MRRKFEGKKVQNWHRPLGLNEQTRKFQRHKVGELKTETSSVAANEGFHCWYEVCQWCQLGHREWCDGSLEDYPDDGYGFGYGSDDDYLRWYLLEALDNPKLIFNSSLSLSVVGGHQFSSTDQVTSERCESSTIEQRVTGFDRDFRTTLYESQSPLAFTESDVDQLVGGTKEDRVFVASASGQDGANWSPQLLNLFARFWIRSPHTWRAALGVSLVDHLFVKYPVPKCLYNVWRRTEDSWSTLDRIRSQLWFITIAQGGSLKRVPSATCWQPTGRFQQCLFEVHNSAPFEQACFIAEVLRLDGHFQDARRLSVNNHFDLKERNCENIAFLPFWQETVQWVAAHRTAMNDAECQLILQWAHHEFIESQRAQRPRFRWAKRRFATVLERAMEYDNAIRRPRPFHAGSEPKWEPHGWNCEMSVGWSFRELVGGEELWQEGMSMQHCVGGYAASCVEGRSAIVSLQRHGFRSVTIEVCPRTGELRQARGKCNRLATPEEMEVINSWLRDVVQK